MNTKPIIIAIIFILSGIFYYSLTSPTPVVESFQISRVIDGDTVDLSTGQRIRLKGINTPESSMKLYKEAKELLQNLIQNKSVQLESHGTDKYGRTLAYIFFNDKNINEKILEQGLGTLYYYEKDNHYEKLRQAEEFARINQKGLWQKSINKNCIELIELKTDEPEKLTLQNKCDKKLEITFKDDATHIYIETLKPNSIFTKTFSHIWNTDGDSIYIRDTEGLLIFYRYS
jgi:endonuclease YncB( thermonuclease family)